MHPLLKDYVFLHGYARWTFDADGRGEPECFETSVARTEAMHLRRFAHLRRTIVRAFDAVRAGQVLPAMRSLQYGGAAIERNHVRLYNTWGGLIDEPARFAQALYLMLCGSGIGFSVQPRHVDQLPAVAPVRQRARHRVEDSIEGWARAVDALVQGRFAGVRVDLDVAAIRPTGSRCVTSGGYAPGPAPLVALAGWAHALFDAAEGRRLQPIEAYDLLCQCAETASAGQYGRSAMLALFSPDDRAMREAKCGDWYLRAPWRRQSNNSAVLLRDQADRGQLRALLQVCREWGDPGVFWTDHPDYTSNSCVECGFDPVLDLDAAQAARLGRRPGERVSGWQGCTLSEINIAALHGPDDLIAAAQAAAVINTLQAAYTDVDAMLGPVSRWLCERDALIGVGLTGMMDHPALAFDPALQTRAATEVRRTNAEIAAAIGIRPAARTTLVKPAGKTSLVLGGTANGIHPRHAPRYLMRLGTKPHHPAYHHFRQRHPEIFVGEGAQERAVFAVEAPRRATTRDDLTAMDFLGQVRSTLQGWVMPGQVRPGPSHNVSCTVSVRSDEWGPVEDFLWTQRHLVSGVALMAYHGDVMHPLAPLQELYSGDDWRLWERLRGLVTA